MKATMYLGFVCLWIFLFSSVVECKYFMHLFFCFIFKFLTLRPLVSCMLPDHSSFHFFSVDSFTSCLLQRKALISDHKIVSILMHLWMRVCFIHSFLKINTAFTARSVSKNRVSVSPAGEKKSVCRLSGNKPLELRSDGCF